MAAAAGAPKLCEVESSPVVGVGVGAGAGEVSGNTWAWWW